MSSKRPQYWKPEDEEKSDKDKFVSKMKKDPFVPLGKVYSIYFNSSILLRHKVNLKLKTLLCDKLMMSSLELPYTALTWKILA